jgi:hypothetical protein
VSPRQYNYYAFIYIFSRKAPESASTTSIFLFKRIFLFNREVLVLSDAESWVVSFIIYEIRASSIRRRHGATRYVRTRRYSYSSAIIVHQHVHQVPSTSFQLVFAETIQSRKGHFFVQQPARNIVKINSADEQAGSRGCHVTVTNSGARSGTSFRSRRVSLNSILSFPVR